MGYFPQTDSFPIRWIVSKTITARLPSRFIKPLHPPLARQQPLQEPFLAALLGDDQRVEILQPVVPRAQNLRNLALLGKRWNVYYLPDNVFFPYMK